MADRLPAIDTAQPVGQRFPVVVRDEIAAVAAAGVTKASIGLGSVDNTSDADKPVSVATAAALAAKANKITDPWKLYASDGTGELVAKSYSNAPAGGTIAERNSSGSLSVGTPDYDDAATPKSYVDALVGSVADGAITAAKLASNAVTTVKIADGNVTSAKLADGAVTSAKILDGTIATADLADGSVTSAKIADGTIAAGDLASNAVTTVKILDGNVTTAKLADNSVTSAKIVDGTIATADLADGAVTSAKIADGTVALADLTASVQTSLGKADAALVGVSGITGVWMGASGSLPATGAANVLYVVSG